MRDLARAHRMAMEAPHAAGKRYVKRHAGHTRHSIWCSGLYAHTNPVGTGLGIYFARLVMYAIRDEVASDLLEASPEAAGIQTS